MDALDIRIVRTMGVLPYGPLPRDPNSLKPVHIARSLGVTSETARERVARMESSGVIQSYQVYPNLRHLGLDAAAFLFRVEDDARRKALSRDIDNVDGVLEVIYFLGPEVCVDLSYRSPMDLQRKLGLFSSLTGDASPGRFYFRPMPEVDRPLSNLDWRILRALRGRARRPLAEVAKEVGVSYRTVKRRYDRMAREGSFFAVPVIDFGKLGGLIPFVLLFHLRPGDLKRTIAAILEAYNDEMVFGHVPASPEYGNFDVAAFAESPVRMEEMRQRGTTIPGVERVVALVYRGATEHTAWIDDFVDAKIAETARGASEPRRGRGSAVSKPESTDPRL